MVCRAWGRSIAGLATSLALAGAACGIDLADGGAATDTDPTEDDNSPAGSSTGATTADAAESGTSGFTGEPGGGSSGDSDGTPTDTAGGDSDSDCELECSGLGYCEPSADGPTCVCDSGSASTGLDCIPCEPIESGMLPAQIPAIRASFAFFHNGEQPPASGLQYGRVSLRNQASGDVVELGATYDTKVSVFMVPGIYDVQYEHRQGIQMPRN
ncbi:MAG: hypothetical protein KUG77_02700, partial [Nannocystaceae bacterium]|nr:hypothetical protein [Nannocystaceae bacterium]